MPQFNNYIVDQLLIPSAFLFFLIGGIAAVVVGIGLIVNSAAMFRFFDITNHSVSTRHMARPLAIPHESIGFVLKHRGSIAAFFTLGAAYSLYGLVAHIDNAAVVAALKLDYPPAAVLVLVESVRLLLIVGCAVAFVVGILLAFFPNAVRTLDAQSSRWVSTRQVAPNADRMNLTLDKWVIAFPRAAGWVILVPALGIVMHFGMMLLLN